MDANFEGGYRPLSWMHGSKYYLYSGRAETPGFGLETVMGFEGPLGKR